MPSFRFVHAIEISPARANGEDRAQVFELPTGVVIALADGAGGTRNGATAAQAIIDAVGATGTAAYDWCAMLAELDLDGQRLGHGQSTAVVLSIGDAGVSGASVGDSVRGSCTLPTSSISRTASRVSRWLAVDASRFEWSLRACFVDRGQDRIARYSRRPS